MKFSREIMPLKVTSMPYFIRVASNIPKWQIFKLLRWMLDLYQSMWDHEIVYADRSSKDEQLIIRPFL
jgi:hypothetical protein